MKLKSFLKSENCKWNMPDAIPSKYARSEKS